MKRLLYISLALVIVGLSSGCASFRYEARSSNPREEEDFTFQSGWSCDLEGGKMVKRVSERETIGAFRVRTNYLYALGTVFSFGFWMPVDVIYEVNQ